MTAEEPRRGILALGNLLVDKMHRINAYPPESFLAVINASAASPGGGVLNVLFDLARLDPSLPLAAAGLVGDDADGRFLRDECAARGIDTRRVGTAPGLPTSFTQVMISEHNATRTFFHAHGANSRFGLDQVRAAAGPERIAHLAYLLLLEGLDAPDGDYGSGGAHALALLRSMGFRTSLDLISDPDLERYRQFALPALRHTDFLIINEVEAASLTGLAPAVGADRVDWSGAFGHAERLLELGVGELVAIHFPQGAVAATRAGERAQQGSLMLPKAEIASTLGAGDAFCAGMLFGLHQGAALARCLQLALGMARCNLQAESATGGAVPLERLLEAID
jgi:sugar/nucleoside kinase (ribokinase family)